ncbi:hypothetical protein ACOME3_006408 [Neoechinorhynchus agilis]
MFSQPVVAVEGGIRPPNHPSPAFVIPPVPPDDVVTEPMDTDGDEDRKSNPEVSHQFLRSTQHFFGNIHQTPNNSISTLSRKPVISLSGISNKIHPMIYNIRISRLKMAILSLAHN